MAFDLDPDSSQVLQGDDDVTLSPEGDDAVTSFAERDENKTFEDPDTFLIQLTLKTILMSILKLMPYSSLYPTHSRNALTRFSEE